MHVNLPTTYIVNDCNLMKNLLHIKRALWPLDMQASYGRAVGSGMLFPHLPGTETGFGNSSMNRWGLNWLGNWVLLLA